MYYNVCINRNCKSPFCDLCIHIQFKNVTALAISKYLYKYIIKFLRPFYYIILAIIDKEYKFTTTHKYKKINKTNYCVGSISFVSVYKLDSSL